MTDRQTGAVLSVHGLHAGYGGKPVLQGVDLSIGPGEIIAVIGRNGVGKSTLMRALVGLLPAMQGEIRLRDVPLGRLSVHRRARAGMGYVPQGRDVFGRLTVEENLRVAESLCVDGKPDLARAYDTFPILRERRRQRAGTLSGGQQQMLAIGRVLIGNPALLLLDEPSEGIQPSIVQDIARILVALNRETGTPIMLVEQNLDMIRSMAQRCAVMDKGRITADLSAQDLQDRSIMRRHLAV